MVDKVEFVEGTKIGEFTYGIFEGTAERKKAESSRWDSYRGEMREPVDDHWQVTITGADGRSWKLVKLKVKRGRTIISAIKDVCKWVENPDKIVAVKGVWGSVAVFPE